MFSVHLRDVPEHRVVVERGTVALSELSDYLQGSMARVHALAQEHGGVAGTTAWPYLHRDDRPDEPVFFVVYHGNPNDGPVLVETCTPVRTEGADVVFQPAHREAFVRLTRAQTAPPSIGEAYEAVEAWIFGQHLTIDGPPREVYYTDFFGAGPDEDVFDVAFPIA
jgi:hypothetical protein